jgi:hypothetical protein
VKGADLGAVRDGLRQLSQLVPEEVDSPRVRNLLLCRQCAKNDPRWIHPFHLHSTRPQPGRKPWQVPTGSRQENAHWKHRLPAMLVVMRQKAMQGRAARTEPGRQLRKSRPESRAD